MFCIYCGTENPEASQFCAKCGKALARSPRTAETGPRAPAPVPSVPRPYPGASETSGKAIASLICGILFFFLPAAIAAIILGHLSLAEIRRSAGRLAGEGTAIAGLLLGYLGIAFVPFMVIVAAIAIPSLLRARMAANEASAVGSLRTIAAANVRYLSTYGNRYAPDLRVLDGAQSGSSDCNHAHLIDEKLASGLRNGYEFTYTAKEPATGEPLAISADAAAKGCTVPGAVGFAVTADPRPGERLANEAFSSMKPA